MDEFIESKNITYHFVEKVKVGKLWHRRYYCSSCAVRYPLMFTEGVVCDPRSVRKGYLKCMCATSRRLSNCDWKIYINSYLKPANLVATEVYDKGNYKYVKGYCRSCKEVAHLPDNYDCSLTTLERGHLPCGCADSFQWDVIDQESRIKSRCEDLGLTFVGFLGKYENSTSKIVVEFSDGFQQTPIIANFMNRDYKDPREGGGGFNKANPAYFYIVRWYGSNTFYLKFGITNQEVIQRVKQQARKAKLDYTILHEFYHEDGNVAYDCEKYLMSVMETGVCTKELLPDGYTETCHDTQQNIDLILSQLNKFGLKHKYNYHKENTNVR